MPLPVSKSFLVVLFALTLTLPWRIVPAHAAGEPHPALALIEAQHWKRARAMLEPEQKAKPDDPVVLAALAEVRAEYGDLDAAEKLAERAVELAPKDGRIRATLANVVGEKAGKAGALSAMGLAKRFRRTAEAALALDPSQIDPRFGLMEFHLRAPGIAGGDKKQAKVMVDEIAKLSPARGELARARMEQIEKDTTRLEAHYRRAVELDPTNLQARLSLAGWLAAPWRAKWAEVEQHGLEARRLAPGRSTPIALMAQVYASQAKFGELDALLAAAATDCPDNRAAWYQAGRILLLDNRDLPRAEKYFRHYLGMEPEAGSPSLAHAHWRLALVLEKQGRKADAVAELQTAMKLNPGFDEAKKDLKRLRS